MRTTNSKKPGIFDVMKRLHWFLGYVFHMRDQIWETTN